MINLNEYSWEDINIVIEGKPTPLTGVTEITYGVDRNTEPIYGRGNDPIAMGKGKKTPKGSITVLKSEFDALQASMAAGRDITDKEGIVITVSYDPESGAPITDRLVNVHFGGFEQTMNTDSTHMTIQLPLFFAKLELNV